MSPTPDKDLGHLHPDFRAKIELILLDLTAWCIKHRPGYKPVITEGFRSTARQQYLYAQGRTRPGQIVTERDGIKRQSNHQSALSADFALRHGFDLVWDDEEFWQYLGHCARAHKLEWGGDWKSFVDKPHVQWPEKDKRKYRTAQKWIKQQGL